MLPGLVCKLIRHLVSIHGILWYMAGSNLANCLWQETLQTKLIFSLLPNCTLSYSTGLKTICAPIQPTNQLDRNKLDERRKYKWEMWERNSESLDCEGCAVQFHPPTYLAEVLGFCLIPSSFGLASQSFMTEHFPKSFNLSSLALKTWMCVWQCAGYEGIPADWITTSTDHCVFKGNGVWGKCGNWDILMATKMLHSKQWLFCVCPFSKHFCADPTGSLSIYKWNWSLQGVGASTDVSKIVFSDFSSSS